MNAAIREFVTDPSTGKIATQFTDIETGRQLALNEILNYQIVARTELGSVVPVNAGITSPVPPVDPNAVVPPVAPVAPLGVAPVDPVVRRGSGNEVSDNFSDAPRNQGNNFGYINKPSIMGMAGMIPGPLGMAGKVANGIVNANNVGAISTARQSMGLEGTSGLGVAKGILSDQQGQVADVNVNGQTYSVGLEGQTKDGRTTLTPNEARNRGLTLGGLTEATAEESQANVDAYNTDQTGAPKQKGLVTKAIDTIKTTLGFDTAAPLANAPSVATPTAVSPTMGTAPTIGVDRAPLAAPNAERLTPVKTGLLGRPSPVSATPAKVSTTTSARVNTAATPANVADVNPARVNTQANPLSPVKTGLLGRPTPNNPSPVSASYAPDNSTKIPSVPRSAFSPNAFSDTRVNTPVSATTDLEGRPVKTNTVTLSANSKYGLEGLNPDIKQALSAVNSVVGPVSINSGYRTPAQNKEANGATKSQHMHRNAVDLSTVGWSMKDKVDAMEAAAQKGVKGFGISEHGTMIHMDTRENPSTWGYRNSNWVHKDIKDQPVEMRKTLTDVRDAGRYKVGPLAGPMPTGRPAYTGEVTKVSDTPQVKGLASRPTATSRLGSIVNTDINDISKMSSGRLTSLGVSAGYTDKEIDNIAFMTIGEAMPNVVKDAVAGKKPALDEISGILSTVVNRSSALGVGKALNPKDYNSLSTRPNAAGNIPSEITKDNWNKYGKDFRETVKNIVNGGVESPLPDATHYANRDKTKDHKYYGAMEDVGKFGYHTIGTIPGEYNQKNTPAAKRQVENALAAASMASDYGGFARKEQQADRRVADTRNAPKTGLGIASSPTPSKSKVSNEKEDDRSTRASKTSSKGLASKSTSTKNEANDDRSTRSSKGNTSSSSKSSSSSGKGLGSRTSGSMGPSSRGSTGSSSKSKSDSKNDSKGGSKSSGGGKSSSKR